MDKLTDFLEKWTTVITIIVWAAIILVPVGWTIYNDNQKVTEEPQNAKPLSSKSSIYYSEVCPITTCSDGACSRSTGRGTCSHHGGVRD